MEFRQSIPIFRMFSIAKAREFYVDFLGCQIDWEHRFEPDLPLYMQVTRGGLTLHLTEHYGDCTPGARVFVEMQGVAELQAELIGKAYGYLRPGLQKEPWGLSMTVTDPFMNRITFNDRAAVGE